VAYEIGRSYYENTRLDLARLEAALEAWTHDVTPAAGPQRGVGAPSRTTVSSVDRGVTVYTSVIAPTSPGGPRTDVAVFSAPGVRPARGAVASTIVINAGTVAAARPLALELAAQGATVICYTHGGLSSPHVASA